MNTLQAYNLLKKFPAGSRLFSWAVCFAAPFFFSIRPHVEELRENYCQVSIKKRRRVQNHLKTVHAIAMCNMAELTGGLMTDVSTSASTRWIPSGMTVKYLKKAKTDLIAIADGSGIDWPAEGDVIVPVVVKDTHGDTVFTADITMNIKHSHKH